MATYQVARRIRRGLFLSQEIGNSLVCPRCTTLMHGRGIKKIPRKPLNRDGHEVNPYNLYWEDRMSNVPRPPLWIEPVKSHGKTPASKVSRSFSNTEKRIAATAVFTMIAAVVSFKLVFGKKGQKTPASSEENQVPTQ